MTTGIKRIVRRFTDPILEGFILWKLCKRWRAEQEFWKAWENAERNGCWYHGPDLREDSGKWHAQKIERARERRWNPRVL